jgi:hypothetical protein
MTNTARKLLLGLLGGGGLSWPLDFDFSAMPNGALPAPLVGSTWSISSGVAVNGTTPGATMLTDGSLEANYTAGKCDTLSKSGTPTLAQSADAHAGSKAQSFIGTGGGDTVTFPNKAVTACRFYRFMGWGKRTAGTTDDGATMQWYCAPLTLRSRPIESAAYQANGITFLATDTTLAQYAAVGGAAPANTVLVDDFTLQQYTYTEMFAAFDSGRTDVTLKVRGTWVTYETFGLIARADSTTNPQNFISLMWGVAGVSSYFELIKWVAGVPTQVAEVNAVGIGEPSSASDMELRISGTTVQMYWAGAKVGGDYTISDAAIVSNDIHGFLASGGSQVTRFFAAAG